MPKDLLLEDVGPGDEVPGFDIDDPALPREIQEAALRSGGYPYDEEMKRKPYEAQLELLQIELLKLQRSVQEVGQRVVVLFEGRDAAGKGGTINAFMQHLNPRHAQKVALAKPTAIEEGQWYFQRYVAQLPAAGNVALFDRSWYNRAGVERVMGFCTEAQALKFLDDAAEFEKALVRDGLTLIKLWLEIGREMQIVRFHSRRHHPLKRWKLTNIDIEALAKWNAYGEAQRDIFSRSHTDLAPWFVVRSNDKRRARVNAIRAVLAAVDYRGKNPSVAEPPDPEIVLLGHEFSSTNRGS